MKPSLLLSTLFIAVSIFSGCDSGTNSGPSLATVAPKAGSSYTYFSVELDSLGRQIPGSDRMYTDSVMETDLSYEGKTRVMRVTRFENDFDRGDAYYCFELNGDISAFIDFGGFFPFPSLWITYPVQSHQPKTYTVIDTTLIVGGQSMHITTKVTLSNEGISSMTIHDSTLMLTKIKVVGSNTITPDPENMSYSVIGYTYFAPSIGYVAQNHSDPYKIPDAPYQNGEDVKLVDYILP